MLGELRCYWHSEYDVNVMFDLRFQCDLDPDKRSFLEKEFPGCPVLFADASGVTEARVLNVKNGEHQRIDAVDVFIAGFACTSRSALNNKAKGNKGCVRAGEGREETSNYQKVKRVRNRPNLANAHL